MNENFLTPEMLALVPIIASILEIMKRIEVIDKVKKWMPFISMLMSLGVIYLKTGEVHAISALVMGLIASGLYSSVKAVSKKGKKPEKK